MEKAAEKIKGDDVLDRRIAHARFAHACLTYIRALNETQKTMETARIARQAFDTANALRREYGIMVKLPTRDQLKGFYFPPVADESQVVLELPIQWDFKIDPANAGQKEEWYKKNVDTSWKSIRTDQDWTGQGYGYHGAAWYHVSFNLPAGTDKAAGMMLLFGAVDGYADIYLDGVKIGEQKEEVGVMWDKPFAVSLPSGLDSSKTHHLTLRVEKDRLAAGIWKPVKIVKMKR